MPLLVPVFAILIQFGIVFFVPKMSWATSYIAMVVAPILAAAAVIWRGRSESDVSRIGWHAIAGSMGFWAVGAFGNLWEEWIMGRVYEMHRGPMLCFDLAAVPLAFVLAGDWRIVSKPMAQLTDAVMALALGFGFFLYAWSVLTARGTPDEAGVAYMIWLIDIQNLLLTLGALLRWYAADASSERRLFGALFVYQFFYQVILYYNNHFVAGDPSFGPAQSSIVTIAFAVLIMIALSPNAGGFKRRAGPKFTRQVRALSPIILSAGLLVLSLFLIRINYPVGTAGIVLAVAGYTLRHSFNQASHIERGDLLQQERTELQAIAWSDALTGLANRHMLHRTLDALTHNDQPLAQPLAVLMLDLDYFKNLNDHYGHPTGDACLKAVARALQQAAARPSDVVARYGGEEFMVLVGDTDEAGTSLVAERLRAAVAELAIDNAGSPLGFVTASVGAASASRLQRVSASELIATADRALYAAKRAGRNQTRTFKAGVAAPGA